MNDVKTVIMLHLIFPRLAAALYANAIGNAIAAPFQKKEEKGF